MNAKLNIHNGNGLVSLWESANVSSSQGKNRRATISGLKLQTAELVEQAINIHGGIQAILEIIERNRPEPEEPIDVEVLQDADDDEEEAHGRSPEPEPESEPEPVRHIRKVPLSRKKRTPWSEEEERFLIKVISEHGSKWSQFEAKYSRKELFGRNQLALKDKARNIMRRIIDTGNEEIWLKKYPKWAQVSVGAVRRGVHAYDDYEDGLPPEKVLKRRHQGIVEESEDNSD